jgi:hypothetical protein
MRVKIVVQDPAWMARMQTDRRDIASLLQTGWRRTKQLLCGLRGHDYQLRVQHRRMALFCPVCEHSSVGWDLTDPTPRINGSPDRPRYLELLRKRG